MCIRDRNSRAAVFVERKLVRRMIQRESGSDLPCGMDGGRPAAPGCLVQHGYLVHVAPVRMRGQRILSGDDHAIGQSNWHGEMCSCRDGRQVAPVGCPQFIRPHTLCHLAHAGDDKLKRAAAYFIHYRRDPCACSGLLLPSVDECLHLVLGKAWRNVLWAVPVKRLDRDHHPTFDRSPIAWGLKPCNKCRLRILIYQASPSPDL